MFKPSTYINRRNALQKKVSSGIILILGNVETPMNYAANTFHFRQDSNFLYFFGLDEPGLAGVIDIDNNRHILFGNDVDIEDIIWMGPQKKLADKALNVGIDQVRPSKELSSFIAEAVKIGRKIHFTPPYLAENKILLESLTDIKPSLQKSQASLEMIKAIVSLRSYKNDEEIAELEKAAEIGFEMHLTAMKMARAGIMESEIVAIMESIPKKYNGMTSFPIILSQNGETLHNHDHSQVLQDGRLLMVDAGAETRHHYASDFTRTLPVSGKFTQRQSDIHNIVLAANNKATELAAPGIKYQQVHLECAKVIARGLKDLGLMKGNIEEAVNLGAHAMFFPHGLGHMMGLDVHDMEDLGENYVGYDEETQRSHLFGTAYLRLGRKLEPGFVFTNEPGIYFIPALIELWKKEGKFTDFINYAKAEEYIGFGGIRMEDDLLITPTGCRLIGKRLPATAEEIEHAMSS